MPYSKFTLNELKQKFSITLTGSKGKFNNLPEVAPSQFILEALEEYLPLAVAICSATLARTVLKKRVQN